VFLIPTHSNFECNVCLLLFHRTTNPKQAYVSAVLVNVVLLLMGLTCEIGWSETKNDPRKSDGDKFFSPCVANQTVE
jgi:hypothetical protein